MTTSEPRVHPRISINKLGEYLVASPLRRREIIERQKYPSYLVGSHYEPARRLLVDFLLGRQTQRAVLEYARSWLEEDTFESDYARHRANGCADAVHRFLALAPTLDFRGLRPMPPRGDEQLHLEGVTVSLRPDIVLRGVDGRGRPIAGAVKLHFPKTHPLTAASAAYVATALHVYLRERPTTWGVPLPQACMAVDVFSDTLAVAPRAHRRRMRELAAACAEIRETWPFVEPTTESVAA